MTVAKFAIADRIIGDGSPCFVIAEIGINHGGSVELAVEMLRSARRAGADAAKFQTVDVDESYVPGTASYREFKDKALDLESYRKLVAIGQEVGIVVFTTPADPPGLELARACGMPAFKVSSSMLASTQMIEAMGRTGLPIIMSTGMGNEREVDRAVAAVRNVGRSPIALLQCTSLYPAPAETLNLSAMATLRARYGCPVGYSDHHLGDLAVTTAVGMGASVIEKHFSLDRSAPGADHALSLEPADFAEMVKRIRMVEAMKGDGVKRATAEEERLKLERHRCLIARRDIRAGQTFSADDICMKRPLPGQVGLPPDRLDSVLGKRSAVAIAQNAPIREQDIA